ncbi:MAG: hypothetical protein KJ737_04310 [Proteobacteria bacterium]|nr:hypothetical protein [Pseudomonadota bacterium]
MKQVNTWAMCFFVISVISLTACGDVTFIATIPDAENSLITSDGRLFVSGSYNLYEITREADGTFISHRLIEEDLYFGGLGEYNGHVYTLKSGPGLSIIFDPEPVLVISDLNAIHPQDGPQPSAMVFKEIPLTGMVMPNGLAIDSEGHLFIADFFGAKIYRCDIHDNDPENVDGPYDCGLEGLALPNGLAIVDSFLYFTDGGSVKKAEIMEEGVLGPAQVIFSGRIALDDLTAYQDSLVVCDSVYGTIFQLSTDGNLLRETKAETFAFPSSVCIGSGPMFGTGDVIVTEKGILYEPKSSFGNRVVLFKVDTP